MPTPSPALGVSSPRLSEGVLGAVILAHLVVVAWVAFMAFTRALPPPTAPSPLFVRLIEADTRQPEVVLQPVQTMPTPPPSVPLPPVIFAPPAPARTEAVRAEPVPQKPEPARPEIPRTETPNASALVATPPAVADSPKPAPAAVAPPPVPVTQPRFNADYLDNPKPPYPSASRRMGEEGEVRLRVQVDAAGNAQQIELYRSSGFPRLDQAALDTVKQWRFIPARQGDQPITAWVIVPIQFSLRS